MLEYCGGGASCPIENQFGACASHGVVCWFSRAQFDPSVLLSSRSTTDGTPSSMLSMMAAGADDDDSCAPSRVRRRSNGRLLVLLLRLLRPPPPDEPPLERRREAELRRGVRDAECSGWYRQFAGVEATEASEAGDHATRAGVEEGSKERRREAMDF